MDSHWRNGLGDTQPRRAEDLLIEAPHRRQRREILRRTVGDEAASPLTGLDEVLRGYARQSEDRAEYLGAQYVVQVQYRIEVLMPEAPSIAQQSEEATLLTTTDVDSHPLDIVGGIEEQLREERLGEQDELMLLVGTCYGVEQGDEHRHVAHGGEADDEVAGHR